MKTEVRLKVKSKFVKKYKNGYPLITQDTIMNHNVLDEEGRTINLVDEQNNFISKGYYGKQNKGLGWVLSSNEKEQFNYAFLKKTLKSAIAQRECYYKSSDTTAFRVFNGEGDGIGGLTIDYFDGYYLITWYSKGIYHFREFIIESLKELVDYKAIYQKKRFDESGKYIEEDDFVAGERGEFPIIVKENGVNIAIYLNDSAMVGVFLDQKDVRKALRDGYTKGKRVLNTFSYTGVFSVFSALGGAKKTTSVDLANRSKRKTIEQFKVNGIKYEDQDIIVEDVFNYFKYAVRKGLLFDVVILDPPSFAKSKKFVFSAEKDYKNLLKDAISITEDNGTILASTNSSSFDMDKFKGFIDTAFKESKKRYKIMEEFSLPDDFRTNKHYPESDYLKVVFIKKIK